MKEIILASASPRRTEIFRNHGFQPHIIPAHIDETLPFAMTPEASTMYLALKKAFHTSSSADCRGYQDLILIAADTIVVLDGRIIGKPSGPSEAFDTLMSMRERAHHVITGVCIIDKSDGVITAKRCLYEKTAVFFKNYSNEDLAAYVKTSEPYDKAGGYAIQGTFAKYVDHIEGDYDNVVGFPWKAVEPFLTLT